MAFAGFVQQFESQFAAVAFQYLEEEKQQKIPMSQTATWMAVNNPGILNMRISPVHNMSIYFPILTGWQAVVQVY